MDFSLISELFLSMVLKFLTDMSVNIAVFRDTKTCMMAISSALD